MTIWDFLKEIFGFLPPIAGGGLLLVAGGVFINGFHRYGMNFIKYGTKQIVLDESIEKRFDELGNSFENRINDLGNSFENRINDLGNSFETRFNDLGNSFETRINDLGKSLEKRIDELAVTQTTQNQALEKRIDGLEESFENRFNVLDKRIDGLQTELDTIKTNHFGHLKSYLEILDGILLDKNIISNKEKAMLDSQLRDM